MDREKAIQHRSRKLKRRQEYPRSSAPPSRFPHYCFELICPSGRPANFPGRDPSEATGSLNSPGLIRMPSLSAEHDSSSRGPAENTRRRFEKVWSIGPDSHGMGGKGRLAKEPPWRRFRRWLQYLLICSLMALASLSSPEDRVAVGGSDPAPSPPSFLRRERRARGPNLDKGLRRRKRAATRSTESTSECFIHLAKQRPRF